MVHTLSAATTDDLMRRAIKRILKHGTVTRPSRGQITELCGVALELTNPRSRVSRSEGRGRIFSCLGETCWYLSGSNAVEPISYYVPAYQEEAENGLVYGGYGPRLLGWDGRSQIEAIIETLRAKPSSRRAVIQLFDHEDLHREHKDVPCTCTLQFLVRGGSLHVVTYMRSNDVYLGLPHDIFAFTMLQELVARAIGVDIGIYTHFVGSLHLYQHNEQKARQFLKEGWLSSKTTMPSMPKGDQWGNVRRVIELEEAIRNGTSVDPTRLPTEPYWADIVRLLQVYAVSRVRDLDRIDDLRRSMSSTVYDIYIQSRLDRQ
ncbi:thymidylate synthase [Micromonospora sp. NPDC004704]